MRNSEYTELLKKLKDERVNKVNQLKSWPFKELQHMHQKYEIALDASKENESEEVVLLFEEKLSQVKEAIEFVNKRPLDIQI